MSTIQKPGVAQPDAIAPSESIDAATEEWAALERGRRAAWVNGPTQAEKTLWAERERARRAAERYRTPSVREPPGRSLSQLVVRLAREFQLATEGAVRLLFKTSPRDAVEGLRRAGLEWEEEFSSQPRGRRGG